MADREKVIKGLQSHADGCGYRSHHCDAMECPYRYGDKSCDIEEMCRDALALLKEQEGTINELQNAYGYLQKQFFEAQDKLLKGREAVKPVLDEQTGRIWLCGKCGTYVGFEDNDPHDPNEFDKYCRECGRPVLWEGR